MPGPRMKLPNGPHDAEFWATYKSYLGSEIPSARTFDALIAAYRIAPEFTRKAEATQRDYSRYLDTISTAWGKLHIGSVRPKHVIQLRDAWADTPVAANHLLSVLKTLINWGIPREFSETNPCIHVPKLEVEEDGARPWPAWAYKLIEEHAREDTQRAVLLARYTGQRQADVLRMAPSNIEDGGINVTQQKTGKELWVPLHSDLRSALEKWDGSPYVRTPKGERYTPDRFRAAWTRLMKETPAGRIRKEGFTFHGLRASSVEKLREAGCGNREIEAITGMSPTMITRYSRFADQKRLAKAAVQRLEDRTIREREE
ncbi:MAG: tyrosine-type recombinase/integrase [Methyloceanibacter sp.]